MNKLLPLLLAACVALMYGVAAQAKADSPVTGKTRLGATLKGAKLGRDWRRRSFEPTAPGWRSPGR